MKIFTQAVLFLFCFMAFSGQSQDTKLELIKRHILSEATDLKNEDIQGLQVHSQHQSSISGASYYYLNQVVNGIRLKNSSIAAVFDTEGKLLQVKSRLFKDLSSKTDASEASISLENAVNAYLPLGAIITSKRGSESSVDLEVEGENYSHKTKAELVYWATNEGELKLVWEFDLDSPDENHWFQYFVSALDGSLVEKIDLQISCTALDHSENCLHHSGSVSAFSIFDGSGYRVFPFPVESPIHGDRDLLTEPALSEASPFGWHDTNGFTGPEFTITRGNNVYAYEDDSDTNSPGFSPDGGEELLFDFDLNLDAAPETYQSAAITNLFYANNFIHDVLYVYGFDEAAGNFQVNNYGNGGLEDDAVRAEAQDGGGTNNANMATPEDGQAPRMQMYLWNTGGAGSNNFIVNSPSELEGTYGASPPSGFGPAIPVEGITANLILAEDGIEDIYNICTETVNPDEISGNIALLRRGQCNFTDKVLFAQSAGALAVVVVNNQPGGVITMGGNAPGITIPSVMITQALGESLIDALEAGGEINVTLQGASMSNIKDGSFDNGIIAHEYIHGLTNRLTGGANDVFCLGNEEQMGEGWSDWYGLMVTINLDAPNPVFRPMATFASGQSVDGNGIRPVPYDTSFAVNDFTYADVSNANLTVPHGVGFVWATMLWDLTWEFIDTYGYDDDIFNGSGGNNMMLQLVTEALKLQPCNPGFVDGRDAILLADQLLFDGVNECMIWESFAKRGLGFEASQGSPNSRADGIASFDLPPICQEVTSAPTAAFSANSENTCTGIVQFIDESINTPQSWSWDFGDGTASGEQNPIHEYQQEGTYTVTLTVTNTLGEDELVNENYIIFETPLEPVAEGASGCVGEEVELSASIIGEGAVHWFDSNLIEIGQGNTITVELGTSPETYYAQNITEEGSTSFIGPDNTDFGSGGNHATDFIGTVDFQVHQPLTIESALVVSGATGVRTINLWDGPSATGNLIQSVTVDIDFTGEDRIDLGFEINAPGTYSIGLNQANLYRNDSGALYPYQEEGVLTITGSSAGPDFYYYFYDLEVTLPSCASDLVEAVTNIDGNATFTFEDGGSTISFTASDQNADSYLWDFGDGTNSGETNPVHLYNEDGIYVVSLTVNGVCQSTQEITINTTSTSEENEGKLVIFPNPSTGIFNLENLPDTESYIVQVINLSGKEIFKQNFKRNDYITLDLTSISSGVYIVTIRNLKGEIVARDHITISK